MPAQFLERFAHRFFERGVVGGMFFDQMRHDFRVGFGYEFVAFALKLFF